MPRLIQAQSIPGPAGVLEALLEEPDDGAPHTAAVVCHPHPLFGGTMHNKVVYRMARGLRRAGMVVLRFNFRGVGRSQGEHGSLVGETEDARAALAWLQARYSGLPLALAGFSFGARVITRLGCEPLPGRLHASGVPTSCGDSAARSQSGAEARWLLAAGFPTVQGPAEHLHRCRLPKVFLQSTHDQYGPRADFERAFAEWAEPKRLVWIEAADHFFAGALEEFEAAVLEAARRISPPRRRDAEEKLL
jgi:uncharacterized protein